MIVRFTRQQASNLIAITRWGTKGGGVTREEQQLCTTARRGVHWKLKLEAKKPRQWHRFVGKASMCRNRFAGLAEKIGFPCSMICGWEPAELRFHAPMCSTIKLSSVCACSGGNCPARTHINEHRQSFFFDHSYVFNWAYYLHWMIKVVTLTRPLIQLQYSIYYWMYALKLWTNFKKCGTINHGISTNCLLEQNTCPL